MLKPWREVPEWCLGANLNFGTCFWAMFGNRWAHVTGQIMPDGEIENAAREMAGFDPYIKATDHGELMEAGFQWIQQRGWPGDPTIGIKSWRAITQADIADSLTAGFMVGRAVALPMNAAGDDYDWTDDALVRKATGRYGHAVYAPDPLICVTWARPLGASEPWWAEYGRGVYEIDFGPLVVA